MANQSDVRIQISAETERLRADMARARSVMQQNFSQIEAAGKRFSSALKVAFAGALSGLSLAGGFQILKQFDNLNASLKTVTGSAASAAKAMDQIRVFATETPFTVQEVTDAFIRLKSLGLDTTDEALRSLGNTAAAMGKPLMQFVEAVADATTGEFERLKEFGIKASKQGEEVAFTFQGVTTKIKNNATDINRYLLELGNTKFASGLQDQMNTIGGALSNLQDAFANLVDYIGNLGIRDAIKRSFSGVAQYVNAFSQQLKAAFGKGTDAQIAAYEQRIFESKNVLEQLRTLNKVPVVGGILGNPEEIRQREQTLADMNVQLKKMRDLQSELSAGGEIAEPKIAPSGGFRAARPSTGGGGRARASAARPASDAAQLTEAAAAAKQYSEELKDINDALAEKEIEDTILNPKLPEEVTDKMKETSQAAQEFGFILSSAAGDAISNWQGFGNLLQGILKDIAQLIIKLTVLQPLQEAVTGAVGGAASGAKGLVSSLFSFEHGGIMTSAGKLPLNAYAGGGVANGAQLALFGEGSRPEAFVPLPDGKSIPVSLSGGMSVVINDQRSASSPAAEVSQRRGPNGQEILEITIREEVKKLFNSGYMDKAMTSNYGARRPGISR